jgi:hypothetical protein
VFTGNACKYCADDGVSDYNCSTFVQTLDIGLLHESSNSYRMELVPVRESCGLDFGSRIAADIVDAAVKADDHFVIFYCRKACSLAALVGGPFFFGPTLPPRRRGRLVGVWRSLSLSACPLTV